VGAGLAAALGAEIGGGEFSRKGRVPTNTADQRVSILAEKFFAERSQRGGSFSGLEKRCNTRERWGSRSLLARGEGRYSPLQGRTGLVKDVRPQEGCLVGNEKLGNPYDLTRYLNGIRAKEKQQTT